MRLFIQVQIFKYLSILQSLSLRAKCPNTELLLVVFSCIQTEYGDLFRKNLRIHSECRKIRTRNNSVFGHFSLSVWYSQTHMLGFQAYYSLHTHCLFFFFTLALAFIVIPVLLWITFSTIKFTFAVTWNMFYKCFWFLLSCYHIKCF